MRMCMIPFVSAWRRYKWLLPRRVCVKALTVITETGEGAACAKLAAAPSPLADLPACTVKLCKPSMLASIF